MSAQKENISLVIPKNGKDVEGLRNFANTLKAQFCSLQSVFSGELRKLVDDVVAAAEEVLGKIPAGELKNDWSADDALRCVCGMLASTVSCLSNSSIELNRLQKTTASDTVAAEIEKQITAGVLFKKEAVDAKVAEAIGAKTQAGELVPKELVQQMCSAAETKGLKDGRAAVEAERAAEKQAEELANTRKTAITTAGLPLPPAEVEAILKAADADFTAAQTTFNTRKEAFTKAGITIPDELLENLWLGEASFKVFQSAVSKIPSFKTGAPDPLAGLGGGGGTGEAPKLPRLC